MAMQKFYMTANNGHRQTPATVSGKHLETQLRVKNHGRSVPAVNINCGSYIRENDNKEMLSVEIELFEEGYEDKPSKVIIQEYELK